ncbi:hypothetical protein PENSUB_7241 [Penicillium subrubescens]|jgi:hypothetical protein|uniref:Uncharacterized protein n=1 Tax=Penicillium subrubescens TaxID=1316194 RepID=A0A1Q5TNJ2_9EURO|nr:hypothetical protein PENSUB_7241 [Penicillium subrubescens]
MRGIMSFEVITTREAAPTPRNPARMRFSSQVAGQMTPKAFEVSKATCTPRNAAFELSALKLPWYAVVAVTRVSLVATDEACEFFKIVP